MIIFEGKKKRRAIIIPKIFTKRGQTKGRWENLKS